MVVTWNSERVIAPCLESLAQSIDVECSVFVVDNASTDGTVGIVAHQFQGVHLVPLAENHGFAKACNKGAELGHGELILMLNPDTRVEREALALCATVLGSSRMTGLVGGRLTLEDGAPQPESARGLPSLWSLFVESIYLHQVFSGSRLFDRTRLGWWDHLDSRSVPCISGAFMMARRADWQRLRGFSEQVFMYYEDVDLCARVGEDGLGIWYEAGAVVHHDCGDSSGQADRNLDLLIGETRVHYFRDHGTQLQVRVCQAIVAWYASIRLVITPAVALSKPSGFRIRHVTRQLHTSIGLLRWLAREIGR